jgi:hypothetical protein
MFFAPYFGAFLAFLVAKSEYLVEANFIIQVEAVVTFVMGIYYSSVLSRHLSDLESIRAVHGLRLHPLVGQTLVEDKKLNDALITFGTTLPKTTAFEARLFKWTMQCLWLTTGSVLFDIFFGKFFHTLLDPLIRNALAHFSAFH